MIRGSCITWSQVPAQVRLLPSPWDWEPGHLNICISKRWLPALKLTEEMITFSKDIYPHFKEKRRYNYMFSKTNTLRKRRQVDSCPLFPTGRIKPLIIFFS